MHLKYCRWVVFSGFPIVSQHKHYRKGTTVYPELCRTNSLGLCTGWWAHEWSGKSLRNCKDMESRKEVMRKVPVKSSPEKESKIREQKNMTKMLGAASANESKMLTSFTPHREMHVPLHIRKHPGFEQAIAWIIPCCYLYITYISPQLKQLHLLNISSVISAFPLSSHLDKSCLSKHFLEWKVWV